MTDSPNATILLVEDHNDLVATIGAFLEDAGYACDFAADGMGFKLATPEDA